MKFIRITQQIRYSFLVLALLSHTVMRPALDPQEQQVITIFKEFIDPLKNPRKQFRVYAAEIITLLRSKPKYNPVCDTLQDLVNKNCKNPVEFALKFKRFEGLLPNEVKDMFRNTSGARQQELVAIFKQRLTA